MKKITEIILGALIIAAGVIFALDAFGFADVNASFDGWWTLFIIIPSLSELILGKDRFRGLVGTVLGAALLLAARDVINYGMVWKLMVPAIAVVIGIKLIAKSTSNSEEKREEDGACVINSSVSDFGGKDLEVAKIGAIFGGSTCNLTDAVIQDGSRVDVFCLFGGADIIVPAGTRVKVNSLCLFGGVSDKREVTGSDGQAHVLSINGFCLFGGVDIK